VNSSASPMTVKLTNSGNAPLSISGVSLTGDSAEFAIQSSSSCTGGTSLQPNTTCTFVVVFSPASVGSTSATIMLEDNALGSPHAIALSGSGEDFTVSLASGSQNTQTVGAGGSATYSLTVSPLGGFNQSVSLTCSVAPLNVAPPACTVSPTSATPNGASATQVTLQVSTTGASSVMPDFRGGGRVRRHELPSVPTWCLWLILIAGLASLATATRSRQRNSWLKAVAGLTILAAAAIMVSCGGGGGSVVPPRSPTPAGSYSVTVSGVSGNLSHSTTVTLVVQQ
jgi:hypothetical protein